MTWQCSSSLSTGARGGKVGLFFPTFVHLGGVINEPCPQRGPLHLDELRCKLVIHAHIYVTQLAACLNHSRSPMRRVIVVRLQKIDQGSRDARM